MENTKLNGPIVTDGGVESFAISPDGERVVYRAEQDQFDTSELYSVPIEGGTPVNLNTSLPQGSGVGQFTITPDSRYVVFGGPLDTTGIYEIYRVPIDGPAEDRMKLNDTLAVGGRVHLWRISPDGARVVYIAEQDETDVEELYSVPIEGPASAGVKISGPLAPGADVQLFHISPDSRRVVYLADMLVNNMAELFSVPIDGPRDDWVKLNGPLAENGDVHFELRISEDSSRVMYIANQVTQSAYELYSVPLQGPATSGVRLSSNPGGSSTVLEFARFTPDASRVIYPARTGPGGTEELYSVPVEGPESASVRINHALPNDWRIEQFRISPDSSRVVYRVDESSQGMELYSVPVEGPGTESVRLSLASAPGREISTVSDISPDSSRVVFRGIQDASVFKFYSVPIDGPGIQTVSRPLFASENVFGRALISPDGGRVAYKARRFSIFGGLEWEDLFAVPIDGPGTASLRMNGPMVDNGLIILHQWAPDSNHIVYTADQDTDDVTELYVSYDRPAAARLWNGYR